MFVSDNMHKRKNLNRSCVQMPNSHDFENKNNVIFFLTESEVEEKYFF